jgi:prevent-host-death family protein
MITHINLTEATTLTQLLDRVRQGDEIIISQAGEAIAHITPAKSLTETVQRSPRVPGQYAGKLVVPDDFNEPLPDDILAGFVNPADPINPV